MIGIVDYGAGNLGSVENALAALGLPARRCATPADVGAVDRLVLRSEERRVGKECCR